MPDAPDLSDLRPEFLADLCPTEQALRRAVLAHPKDDGPRLCYADWWEEQGQAARGEFIRVQCEVARTCRHCYGSGWVVSVGPYDPKGADFDDDGYIDRCECNKTDDEQIALNEWEEYESRVMTLRRRERELLEQNWHPWSGIPSATYCANFGGNGAFGVEFRRGFVDAITCRAATFLGGPCECRHWARFNFGLPPDEGHPLCSACRDPVTRQSTGALPGVADALLAREPVRKVVLITEPEVELFGEGCRNPRMKLRGRGRVPVLHSAHPDDILDPQTACLPFPAETGLTRDFLLQLLRAEFPSVEEWELPGQAVNYNYAAAMHDRGR